MMATVQETEGEIMFEDQRLYRNTAIGLFVSPPKGNMIPAVTLFRCLFLVVAHWHLRHEATRQRLDTRYPGLRLVGRRAVIRGK